MITNKKYEDDIKGKNYLKTIFENKCIHKLLQKKIKTYPLGYYFVNQYISRRTYNENPLKEGIATDISSKIKKKMVLIRKMALCLQKAIIPTKGNKRNTDILFITRNRFIRLKDEFGTEYKSDYLFGPLIKELDSKRSYQMDIITNEFQDVPRTDIISPRSLIEYSSLKILLVSFIHANINYIKWSIIKKCIVQKFGTNEKKAQMLTARFFSYTNLLYIQIYDRSLQRALQTTKPRLIIANDDIMQFKPKKGTKMIVVQSASMLSQNEKYRKLNIDKFGLEDRIPSCFLVSGYKYKKIKQYFVDPSVIKVTGQTRYDVLYNTYKTYDKKKFINRNHIKQNEKIILWTTQSHALSMEENKSNLRAVICAVKDLPNTKLLIKQHPAEKKIHKKLIETGIEKFEVNALIMDNSSDIYEQLFCCDILITKNSTTAMEAIALNKPVIILNLSGQTDSVDYVKEGVALGVYNADELKPKIEYLLVNDNVFTEQRESYIDKYLYKFDGKSTERIIQIIDQMLT
ncbi:CDP-glycerol glycerophosphotransferase family protein [Methanohalophilus euhalobius]|jgi:CDP-glycerol glycerophosphotransferase (TagB/SpsB family)|uniref:CDP-glycerol:poly(Glycerophosphate) glycerophosphotransferase n=1 Tax=Methanohalophilus euhalobius TaxID=51203 RepID=A0A314ZYM7_9EURY|nr:CDP-glycerol glycerophosphotransferase family protein [Methanohalophilus euhalobius]PQV41845.1 CDP-glycerol:poly(glycerophosphate) glycerophosphotransferase [Methanohalophilus euhalobius]RNI07228.1 hypothetical protein EDD83_09950 [Methanohalophilus euhalobius]